MPGPNSYRSLGQLPQLKTNYLTLGELSQDLLSRMEAVTLSSGTNFLMGKATTAFAREIDIYNNSMLAVNTAVDTVKNIEKISKELVEISVKKVTNELLSYIQDKQTQILSFDGVLRRLGERTLAYTKENLLSPADILSKVTQKQDEVLEKNEEKKKNENIANLKNTVTEKFGKAKDVVNNTINSVQSGVSTITAYVANGPDWVVSKLNSYIGLIIDKSQGFIDNTANAIEGVKNSAIDALAHSIGLSAAEKINRKAERVAAENIAKAEKLLVQTQLKAMSLITKALMIVRELTGIAIPMKLPKLSLPF